jgi:transposase
MAAVTQQRLGGEGTTYYAKLLTAGKTPTEATRLLRRRLSDRVYQAIRADERVHTKRLLPDSMPSIRPEMSSLTPAA